MKPISIDLAQFDPFTYLRALIAVAASDGIHPLEEAFIRQQAASFGVDPDELLRSPLLEWSELVADLSPLTRRLIYRDCFMLAHLDGFVSAPERVSLEHLRERLGIDPQRASALEDWSSQYSTLLAAGEALLTSS